MQCISQSVSLIPTARTWLQTGQLTILATEHLKESLYSTRPFYLYQGTEDSASLQDDRHRIADIQDILVHRLSFQQIPLSSCSLYLQLAQSYEIRSL